MTRPLVTLAVLLVTLAAGCGGSTKRATATPTTSVSATATVAMTATSTAPATSTARNSPAATATPSAVAPSATAPGSGVPAFSHIYLIVLENKEIDKIVGNADAPYLNGLIAAHGVASHYDGVAHPSQPNYLALVSGSTQGVTDDNAHDLNAPNLADQLEAAGKTWRVFAQNLAEGCFTGDSSKNSSDGSGTYKRKHEPFISFTSISGNPARCANITDFSHFDPAAADFELIVPNQVNSMHDGTVAQGDAFLRDFVPRILDSPAYQQDGLLIITWDEGSSNAGGGGQVPTLVISPRTPAGTTVDTPFNHYALLRTIEDAWGLGCLANACDAPNMAAFFR